MNNQIDTIVALATPPGAGGIAVIRLSGPKAFRVAREIHSRAEGAEQKPRELVMGWAVDGDQRIDQSLAVFFPSPQSYTGEDVVELQLHGSMAAAGQIIDAACKQGARLAEPGEFTKRAYLNGKLDLVQAEAVADVINADTEAALRQAETKASGTVSKQLVALRQQIVGLVARLSADLDFGDEDLPDVDMLGLAGEVRAIRGQVADWLSQVQAAKLIHDGIRVAILGLPNAGKSSLLNALVGFERAIVTEVAGTTRDTLEERLVINGVGVVFVDTAGLRTSQDTIEAMGVARSHAASRQADVILLAASADQPSAELRREVTRLGLASDLPLVAVQTKHDAFPKAISWPLAAPKVLKTSAVTGAGLSDLRQAICEVGIGTINQETAVITSARQVACLQDCQRELARALAAIESGAPGDVVAGELTLAAEQLGGLLGQSVSQEVINEIFSKFCIGK